MSTSDPVQRQMIREAMQAVAERKPGRSKLVYDKTKRTIVAGEFPIRQSLLPGFANRFVFSDVF